MWLKYHNSNQLKAQVKIINGKQEYEDTLIDLRYKVPEAEIIFI